MKKASRFLMLTALVLTFCGGAFAQTEKNFKKYKPRTLAEIPLINSEATDRLLKKTKLEERTAFISFELLHSRVRVEFAGRRRPVSQNHRDMMQMWSKLQNVSKKTTGLYENEFLFKEGDREYWIPVRKNFEAAMVTQIKANDMMTLFVVHVGGGKAPMENNYEWLFLSTGFEK